MPKAKVKDILTYATENRFGVAAINTETIITITPKIPVPTNNLGSTFTSM